VSRLEQMPIIRQPKEKQLIKVVAVLLTSKGGGYETTVGRGIVPLKRGVLPPQFASAFLLDRGISCVLHHRGDNSWLTSPMFLAGTSKQLVTYSFTQFSLSEIGYYGKDLSKDELVRDFKFLKKVLK
jgi:hypothetical protein